MIFKIGGIHRPNKKAGCPPRVPDDLYHLPYSTNRVIHKGGLVGHLPTIKLDHQHSWQWPKNTETRVFLIRYTVRNHSLQFKLVKCGFA